MLNIIIADDEKLIRESLCHFLDWESMGIRIVSCCANGIDALNAVLDEAPDILLTDIKMPGLSGLELIEKIYHIDNDMEFIIISGHQEFEFAKKAMEFGVQRYLLKPIKESDLLEAISKAKESCLRKKELAKSKKEEQLLLQKLSALSKRRFVQRLFANEAVSFGEITEYTHIASIYRIVTFSFLERRFLRAFAADLYRQMNRLGVGPVVDLMYVKNSAVLMLGEGGEAATQLVQWAKSFTMDNDNPGIECKISEYPAMPECFDRLKRSLLRYSAILAVSEIGEVWEVYNSALNFHKTQALQKQLKTCTKKEAAALLNQFFESIEDLNLMRAYAANLMHQIAYSGAEGATDLPAGFFDQIYHEDNRVALISRITEDTLSFIFDSAELSEKSAANEIIKYINENLADSNLSLKRIANELVYMNVDYLGKLFFQKTGMKFSRYLNMVRMEKAKELLKQGLPINSVAEAVGCGHNPRYFSQLFKKYAGVTPSFYAENGSE